MTSGDTLRCIAVLGGPGSGKRSVAAALARRLGWEAIDFDAEVEREAARPIEVVLGTLAEQEIGEVTLQVVARIRARPSVIAFDGRWPANSLAVEQLRPAVLAVWLSASPQEAVRRMRGSERRHRLLEYSNPAAAVAQVLDERSAQAQGVDLTLPTDGRTVEEVAFELEQLVRTRRC